MFCRCLPLVALLCLAAAPTRTQGETARGDVVFQTGFDAADALKSWEGAGQQGVKTVPGREGSPCVLIERPAAEGPGYCTLRVRLPVEKLRGARVRVEAKVKAEGVAEPPNPWNGVKCMLHTAGPSGPRWNQQDRLWGAFDWCPVGFVAEVPSDAAEAWLVLGLEQTSGKAWFDDLKVTVIGHRRRAPAERPAGPAYKGHDLPRLRGAMISPNVTADDLRVLGGQWQANHVRWQLIWGGFPRSPADKADPAQYDAWLEKALAHLDSLLPVCKELGIRVVVDLHTPPGGRNDNNECRMFHERRFQDAFVAAWQKIAARYKGHPAVWGYDLVNEPVEGLVAEGLMDWRGLAGRTAAKVRAIDPEHAIIIEPSPWGSPDALDWFEPLDVPGVVYSVHMYQPFQFTHQGIYGNPTGVAYPGKVHGKEWNKEALRQALRAAVEYQRDYNVHVYIGEFSAIRWAPGESAHDYLRDLIDIFEQQGWDWAYHAFREWDGWSVEHGPDPKDHARSPAPTQREGLLRSWYAKNRPSGPKP